jgi:tRNA(His) 5'-end guanylyltransferase
MSHRYSEFDKRMKKYEFVTRTHLMTRTPVIIRIDGKAFHTFTRGFKRPCDKVLAESMQDTMKYLCENIQGCVLGYTQSDEITLVLIDYKTLETSAWFDYNIQKCASVAASMATMAFNKAFRERRNMLVSLVAANKILATESAYLDTLLRACDKGATFDARVFNVPKEEVCNNILWRQQDAIRNSIQMVGRAFYSDKQLFKKSTKDIKEMLLVDKGINWEEDYAPQFQRGSCCIKKFNKETCRNEWVIDNEIPIFKGEGREYIDDLIFCGENA